MVLLQSYRLIVIQVEAVAVPPRGGEAAVRRQGGGADPLPRRRAVPQPGPYCPQGEGPAPAQGPGGGGPRGGPAGRLAGMRGPRLCSVPPLSLGCTERGPRHTCCHR